MFANVGEASPWTQKRTLSLIGKSHCVGLTRCLTYVTRGNSLVTYGSIHTNRKGGALKRRLQSDLPWLQRQRSCRGFGRAVRPFSAPGLSLSASRAEHQASGGSVGADPCYYH